jgi:putative flippase GtrA
MNVAAAQTTLQTPSPAYALPEIEIVVPVLDEAATLARSVGRLHDFLDSGFPFTTRITIADNGSADGTWAIATALAEKLPRVRALRLEEKGRGRALNAVWSGSDARVLAYMDVDLSTDLSALLPLVAPLLSGHSDLAIGSRLARGAHVVRGPKRELISRTYNAILHLVLGARFSDAQCGFKAIRADRAHELLPLVRDHAWFFDTELLVLAQRAGLRIHEVPVDWTDDADSRVDIVSTALADVKGVARLVRDFRAGRAPAREPTAGAPTFRRQVVTFAAIGVLSTLAYGALYLAFRPVLSAQGSNALALLLTAVANTAANRRVTFSVRGSAGTVRHQFQGLVVFGLALTLTASSLRLLQALDPSPSHLVELATLIVASVLATVLRFVLLRTWVFRAHRTAPCAPLPGPAGAERA